MAVDEVGNMFATRPGKRNDLAPIAMGSHLDTQPTGAKFDGVLWRPWVRSKPCARWSTWLRDERTRQ